MGHLLTRIRQAWQGLVIRRQIRRLMQPRDWPAPRLATLPREERYVAFVDLLGFSHSVVSDLDQAVATYDRLFTNIRHLGREALPTLQIVVASDSVLFTSHHLIEVLYACNMMQFIALSSDTLVRGGLAYGLHLQASAQSNLYVVSPALVAAARLERTVSRPCIALDTSVGIPVLAYPQPGETNFQRLLLFFDGLWIVNPFNIAWGYSAMTRVCQLAEQFPEHRAKYQWFLSLYAAVSNGEPLVPHEGATEASR